MIKKYKEFVNENKSRNTKDFGFFAETSSGLKLELFYTVDGKDDELKVGVRNTDTGFQHKYAGRILPKGVRDKKIPLLYLSNKFINKKLIGKSIEGYVKIEKFDKREFEQAKKEVVDAYEKRIDDEIKSLKDSDIVELYYVITGYGKGYGLSHQKLSHESKKKFQDDVRNIYKHKLAKFTSDNPRDDYGGSRYSVEMSYKDFKELAKAAQSKITARKAKEDIERQAKFDEAKRTGKAVVLDREFFSGSQIPREFREPDSDMGNLITYAMPDGSTKQEFSHSY